MNSLTEENYLKALLSLTYDADEVGVKEVSDHLGIKMPTVTSMMKKLAAKDLVVYEKYKPLRLTNLGKKSAALIIRKHRLTEMFLVEKMGFGWDEVHDIAEQVEHIKSPNFFDKMDEILGFPKVDPHGSPIPDKNGRMEWLSYQYLSDCKLGQTVEIAAVTKSSSEFLQFLDNKQIHLGLQVTIEQIEPFDNSMVLSYGQNRVETLSRVVCERLLTKI
jgi:DtxR family Mn-dependent transcriptional regulator